MKYFLIILIAFLFFGCYESNHRENNKKELVEILTTILVFEQERIILDSEQKISAHSDSNKIFLIPGILLTSYATPLTFTLEPEKISSGIVYLTIPLLNLTI